MGMWTLMEQFKGADGRSRVDSQAQASGVKKEEEGDEGDVVTKEEPGAGDGEGDDQEDDDMDMVL